MRALVTGYRGFVGTHLTDYLRNRDIEVVGFALRYGQDIRNYESIRAVVNRFDPDLVFHLAAQAYVPESNTDPRRGFDVNTTGVLNMLEAVRHTGCRARVLVTGTSEEYGYFDHPDGTVLTEESPCRPSTMYGVTKLAGGQLALAYARTYGIPVVVTRAWNHTGPGQSAVYAIPGFAKKIAEVEVGKRQVLTHGNLDAVRSYMHVHDVVRAYVAAIELPTGVYNVCVDQRKPMEAYLMTLCEMSTVEVRCEPDPALYRPGMQTGSKEFPRASARKLTDATGWLPTYTVWQTLTDTLDYWRAHV